LLGTKKNIFHNMLETGLWEQNKKNRENKLIFRLKFCELPFLNGSKIFLGESWRRIVYGMHKLVGEGRFFFFEYTFSVGQEKPVGMK